MKEFKLIVIFMFCLNSLSSQECISGAIRSNERFLYGRFEVSMKSAAGNGVVSSFFMYNVDTNCNWPEENNEIDIEMTGDDENIQFTTHHPNLASHTEIYDVEFNPHDGFHEYVIEWEPSVVRWFIDGELYHVDENQYITNLMYPMPVLMNLWAAQAESWVGIWDPSIMPVQSEYEYVKCYYYTPGEGNSGSGNNFSLAWEDHFEFFNEERWQVSEYTGFQGNYCTFIPSRVLFENDRCILKMTEPEPSSNLIPVTFRVDASQQELSTTDVINVNGTFNNWCGNCNSMLELENNIWVTTLLLEPGMYQYLYTKNFWEGNGGAPQGSECDFNPCDEFLNYGLVVNENSEPIELDAVCWGQCEECDFSNGIDVLDQSEKTILKMTNLLGQEIKSESNEMILIHYSDGSVIKTIK